MTVWMVRRGDNFKLPAIERMGGIGYLERCAAIAGAVRVVERGINTGYRLTLWIVLIFGNFSSDECVTACCCV
jgi:hypothetical protein